MRRTQLDLIAARAGVSLATASRVMRNEPNVAPATRQRVLEAIQALSPPGRTAALTVALIIPDHDNPFFTNLAFELDRECDRRGASLMIASSDGRADREMHLIERFTENDVDGLLFISSGAGDGMSLVAVGESPDRPPLVSLDRFTPGFDTVSVDPRVGTIEAIDHLFTRGHKRIGYIKGLAGTRTAADRFDVFCEALAHHRLGVNEEWVFVGDFKVESGKAAANELLAMAPEDRPTALLAANDLMAMGVIQRFSEAEQPLPRHMSIVGFDGIPAASWITPKLATIAQPTGQLAREALNLLIEHIALGRQRRDNKPKLILLKSEFQVGDSNFSVADVGTAADLRLVEGGSHV